MSKYRQTFKRVVCLFLFFIMLFSISIPAFAIPVDEVGNKIVVSRNIYIGDERTAGIQMALGLTTWDKCSGDKVTVANKQGKNYFYSTWGGSSYNSAAWVEAEKAIVSNTNVYILMGRNEYTNSNNIINKIEHLKSIAQKFDRVNVYFVAVGPDKNDSTKYNNFNNSLKGLNGIKYINPWNKISIYYEEGNNFIYTKQTYINLFKQINIASKNSEANNYINSSNKTSLTVNTTSEEADIYNISISNDATEEMEDFISNVGKSDTENEEDSEDEEEEEYEERFFTQNRDELDEIYSFTIYEDLLNPIEWLTNNQTFIVVRKYKDIRDNNIEKTKVYVNVPNVQQYLHNSVLNHLKDGYDDNMYTPSSKLLDKVGKSDENVIYKFGFNIPVNRYNGEYPMTYMSMTNVLPTKWYQKIWRGLKALFGFSIIDAPDDENFKSLGYWGNEYYDTSSEKLIGFIQDNWKTFETYLWSHGDDYFINAEDVVKKRVTDDVGKKAESFINTNKDAYNAANEKKKARDEWVLLYSTKEAFLSHDTPERAAYLGALETYRAQVNAFETAKANYKKEHPEIYRQIIKMDAGNRKIDTPIPPNTPTLEEAIGVKRPDGPAPVWTTYQKEEAPEPTAEELQLIEEYRKQLKIYYEWLQFIRRMNNGTKKGGGKVNKDPIGTYFISASSKKDKTKMYYSQCLLKTDEDGKCTKKIDEQDYSVTLNDFYVESKAYTLSKGKATLTRTDAINILTTLQEHLGPAYEESMTYFIITYLLCAKENGVDIDETYKDYVDPRVMPYDIDTLAFSNDRDVITVVDQRAEIYKRTNLVGGLITSWRFNLFTQFFNFNTIAKLFIGLSGKITSLSVFLNQMANLEFFDANGLSPTTMWGTFSYNFIVAILMSLMIISIINYVFKFIRGKAGILQVLGRVIVFILTLAVIIALTVNTERTWSTIKRVADKLYGFGEIVTTDNINNLDELSGGTVKSDVVYYIPYFDLWTVYNTGYHIHENAQSINIGDGTPETYGLTQDGIRPTINGVPTTVWSVMLADSFNEQGKNVTNLRYHGVNAYKVNTNAYRVVDHFIAPRISSENPSDSNLDIVNTENENYNGEFQAANIFTLLGGFFGSVNLFIISIIKFLTLVWFWFMMYIFIFNILLGSAKRDGRMGAILAKTFSPLLFMPLLGAYAGINVQLAMHSTGIINLILNLLLLVITGKILEIWGNTHIFPATLKPINAMMHPVMSIAGFKKRRSERNMEIEAERFGVEKDEDGHYKDEDFITTTGELIYNTADREKYNDAYRQDLWEKYDKEGNTNGFSAAQLAFWEKDEDLNNYRRYKADGTINKRRRARTTIEQYKDLARNNKKIKNKEEEAKWNREQDRKEGLTDEED